MDALDDFDENAAALEILGIRRAAPPMSAMVLGTLQGQADAAQLLQACRGGCSDPDSLHEAVQRLLELKNSDRLRGFCRAVQKALEAA